MELQVIEADDTLTRLALSGRLELAGVNAIQDRFVAQVTTRRKPTIVELSGVDFIASLGMGMLVNAAKRLQRHGAKMALLSPREMVGKALEAAGIPDVIPIAENRERALEMLV